MHANVAFAPNRNLEGKSDLSIKDRILGYARASIGMGLSMQLSSIAIECYFNPLVYRHKNELKSEF